VRGEVEVQTAPGPVLHGGGGLCEPGVLIDGPGRGSARRVVGDPPPGPGAVGGGGRRRAGLGDAPLGDAVAGLKGVHPGPLRRTRQKELRTN
jgi:hypothetical protein